MKKTAIALAAMALAGCQNVHQQVKATCDAHGWQSGQCAYAQQMGVIEQQRKAAAFNNTLHNIQRNAYRPRYRPLGVRCQWVGHVWQCN